MKRKYMQDFAFHCNNICLVDTLIANFSFHTYTLLANKRNVCEYFIFVLMLGVQTQN